MKIIVMTSTQMSKVGKISEVGSRKKIGSWKSEKIQK